MFPRSRAPLKSPEAPHPLSLTCQVKEKSGQFGRFGEAEPAKLHRIRPRPIERNWKSAEWSAPSVRSMVSMRHDPAGPEFLFVSRFAA